MDPCADVPVFGDDGTCLGSPDNCDEYFDEEENEDPEPRDGMVPDDKPVLVAIGDSVTSGHHKERNKNTDCDDRDYAYGNALFEKMNREKPAVWSDRDQYQNFAHSGFGTEQVLGGGTTGCGTKFEGDEVPIKKAVQVLTDHKEKGNFVVMSAGINDTNWVQLLTGITTVTTLNKGLPNAARCESLLLDGNEKPTFQGFNFYDDPGFPKQRRDAIAELRKKVKKNITEIVQKLVAADPKVHIAILNYYNASGTGFSPVAAFNGYKGPFLPEVCKDPVNKRLDSANGLIKDGARAAFDKDADFTARVSVAAVADLNDPKKGMLQSLFLDEALKKDAQPPGWPHPNEKGHSAIAMDMFAIVKPKL